MVKQRGLQKKGLDLIFDNASNLNQKSDEDNKIETPQQKIILYLKDGLNGAERNFTKYPNDIHRVMRDNLKEEAEGMLYIYMWRESWGYGRNYCRVSHSTVTKETVIGSQKTAQRAMSRLLHKHFAVRALSEDGEQNVNNDGGLYRVITPQEIISGKTEEGISIDLLPIEGVVMINMPSVSMVKMTMDNMGSGQNDHSQYGNSSLVNMGMVNMTKVGKTKITASNKSLCGQNDHSQNDQHLKDRSKDNIKDTLSLIDQFYTKIGQTKVAKRKREKAENDIKELMEDGFSQEDIIFAINWTIENAKEKPYDFALIKDTIGQAMAKKREIEIQEQKIAERDQKRVRQMEEEKKFEEEREKIESYKKSLSPEQRAKLRERAFDEMIKLGTIKKELIGQPLIDAKENEILRKEIKIDE